MRLTNYSSGFFLFAFNLFPFHSHACILCVLSNCKHIAHASASTVVAVVIRCSIIGSAKVHPTQSKHMFSKQFHTQNPKNFLFVAMPFCYSLRILALANRMLLKLALFLSPVNKVIEKYTFWTQYWIKNIP